MSVTNPQRARSLAEGHSGAGVVLPGGMSIGREHARPSVVASGYGRRDFVLRRVLLTADALGILVALLAASQASSRSSVADFLLVGALTLPLWAIIFRVYGLYHRDVTRVSHSSVDDVPWLFHALLLGSLMLWATYKLALPDDQLVLAEVLAFSTTAMGSVLVLRAVSRRLVKRRLGSERTLLIGDDAVIGPLVRKIRSHPEYGLEPVGRLGSRARASGDALPDLGGLGDFEATVSAHNVERVIVSHSGLDEARLLDLLRLARELSLKISLLPQTFDVMGPSVEIDDVEGVTLFGMNPPVLSRSSRTLKRSMDLAGALIGLVVLAPLFAAIALAIKLDSKGPVLYRQRRVGRAGKHFEVLKFRSMVVGAEARVAELMSESRDEYWLNLDEDPRITRVGGFLRYTSLDEIPQLWNVVRGEMSLVGPRPLQESENSLIDGWGRSRMDLMPGITGLWQVLGRTNIPFEEMVKLDYLYVTNWSLWRDVRLLLKTLPVVLTRRGAN